MNKDELRSILKNKPDKFCDGIGIYFFTCHIYPYLASKAFMKIIKSSIAS